MDNPSAIIISAAELVARDDRDGALILLSETDAPSQHLAEAALLVFSGVMSGDGATARFDELRGDVHRLAAEVGANDGQVILCLETIAAAQALTEDDPRRARALLSGSVYSPLDLAHAAAAFVGQAVAGWLGPQRTPGFFRALRREYGVGAA